MPNKKPFSYETLAALHEYGAVLRQIHNRLIREGYVIKDGKIYNPDGTLAAGDSSSDD